MSDGAKKERTIIKIITRKILESVKGQEPFIALLSMTTVMASLIISANLPHTDEEIFKTADSTLREMVRIMRMTQVTGMTKQ
ncbi:hypothetical protein UFOVP122_66 [uncultured Caudovirales phage]|uniref:Uncharacterized protein n=1 Tax=uncultured Caudovirales phage TaxID=2100421 RepID=A0A6J5LA24_9CAUD|nr:hypothetical protein UFOVP122_66 [uncultured Caudovirales phage]